MTFDELQELADKDLKINDTELDLESLKTPQLHNKYMKFHNQYTNLLKKAEQDLARLQERSGNIIQVRQTLVSINRNLLILNFLNQTLTNILNQMTTLLS